MSDEIKIDKGVPIPIGSSRGSEIGELVRKMKVGDSFLKPHRFSYSAVTMAVRRAGYKYRTKKDHKDPKNRVRVWRTA